MLTAAELPGGGFTTQPPASGISLGSLPACPDLTAGEGGVTAQTSAAFARSGAGAHISEALLQDSVGGAETMMAAFAAVGSACGSIHTVLDNYPMAITITREGFPAIGDETVALRLVDTVTISGESVTISGDLVGVRHGGTMIVITNLAYPLDPGLTEPVVRLAYAKVAARW